MGNAQITEIIWTVAAIPGLLVWAVNLRNAWQAVRVTKHSGRTAVRLLGGTMLRLALGATLAELTFMAWGIVGMTQPAATDHITLVGWTITAGVVLVALITMLIGFDVRRAMVTVWRLAPNPDRQRPLPE